MDWPHCSADPAQYCGTLIAAETGSVTSECVAATGESCCEYDDGSCTCGSNCDTSPNKVSTCSAETVLSHVKPTCQLTFASYQFA